jgi:rare lipoprotein A
MRIFFGALLSVCFFISSAQAKEVHTKRHHHTAHAGLASWYGEHEQGHRMANGQRFDRRRFTAASRSLPFGTRLMVTNRTNHRSTVVTITDRGPWVKTRILDLAEAPARHIGCSGVCLIQYSILQENAR